MSEITKKDYEQWMLEYGWMPEQINKKTIKWYKTSMDCKVRVFKFNAKKAWKEFKKAWGIK